MKMVKSLLLVSAAGLVGVAGAQAADLPVKAKPVEYVKVCSLYGAGFYYIPGTDICMKIGGYVRYQVSNGVNSSISFGPFSGASGFNNRVTNADVAQRVRATATFDTRQQTAYGTLRTYLLMGYTQDTAGGGTSSPVQPVYMTRGFIQIAGFTFGKATSFFDFVSTAAVAYNAGFLSTPDTGDAGQIVGAYTAQFGNGLSATIAIEQSRRIGDVYVTGAAGGGFGPGAAPGATNNLGGLGTLGAAGLPDIVGNIRIDQAWGSAQISGAAHDVSAAYYAAGPGGAGVFEQNGHPSSKWGWAGSAGIRLNTPMFGPGDYFQSGVVYSVGAPKYASNSPYAGGIAQNWQGDSLAFGYLVDATFGGTAAGAGAFGNTLNLTTAWSLMASYEHFWTPSLRTSLYGSYLDVTYNSNSTGQICTALGAVPGVTQCSANWSVWNIGSRSQWNVTKDLYVGVDVIYNRLNTATVNNGAASAITPPATSGIGAGSFRTADQNAWAATWRIHRDIVP